jgi:hypothetical protein
MGPPKTEHQKPSFPFFPFAIDFFALLSDAFLSGERQDLVLSSRSL